MGSKNQPGAYDCHANAEADEPLFTLLGRDRIGGSLVRLWAAAREQMAEDPAKLAEASDCAALMDAWARGLDKNPADVLDILPMVLLEAAVRRRGAFVFTEHDLSPGAVLRMEHAPLTPTLVLTGKQLRIADQLAEDEDTEVCVGFGEVGAGPGPGLYAWVQGYPASGAVALFDESVPLNETWKRDDEVLSDILGLVGYEVAPAVIAAWSDDQVKQAEEWASATHLYASDNDDVVVPPRPAFLPEPWTGLAQGEGVFETNPTPITA